VSIGSGMTMDEIEMMVIRNSLKKNHGDKAKTAEELGISIRTIYRKLEAIAGAEAAAEASASE
jgi:two-component system NtrC family response regulator